MEIGTDVDTIETLETKHSYIYHCSGLVRETTQLHSAIKFQRFTHHLHRCADACCRVCAPKNAAKAVPGLAFRGAEESFAGDYESTIHGNYRETGDLSKASHYTLKLVAVDGMAPSVTSSRAYASTRVSCFTTMFLLNGAGWTYDVQLCLCYSLYFYKFLSSRCLVGTLFSLISASRLHTTSQCLNWRGTQKSR